MVTRASRSARSGTISVGAALRRLEREVARVPVRTEWVPSAGALGRVPSGTIRARRTLPPHDQSVMDGYAVRSGTSPPLGAGKRLLFRVIGCSSPGSVARRLPRVDRTTAVEVLTGSPLPPGADAVVRSEQCRRSREGMEALAPLVRGRDIARRGEDFRPGRRIAASGTSLRPWHIAALLANEVLKVRVRCLPRVGVMSTGDELIAAGAPRRSGGVRDTTKPLVLALLAELGVPTRDLGNAPDDEKAIRRKFRQATTTCDVVISIGGSGPGGSDRVREALRGIAGVRWLATRLRLRPGGTSGVAIVRRRPLFVLPGPPVAAFAGFAAVVEPFLRGRGGVARPTAPTVTARLDAGIPHVRGVRELVRVELRGRGRRLRALALERRGAARLSSLTRAAGLLMLEERRRRYRRGESVRVLCL